MKKWMKWKQSKAVTRLISNVVSLFAPWWETMNQPATSTLPFRRTDKGSLKSIFTFFIIDLNVKDDNILLPGLLSDLSVLPFTSIILLSLSLILKSMFSRWSMLDTLAFSGDRLYEVVVDNLPLGRASLSWTVLCPAEWRHRKYW